MQKSLRPLAALQEERGDESCCRPHQRATTQNMDGEEPNLLDQLDKTPDKNAFIELYCRLARDRGISFSKDDLLIAVQEQKHGKNWILPKPVLMMVREKF